MKEKETPAPHADSDEILDTARRGFLKKLAVTALYVAPVITAIAIDDVPAQFPSPPPPPQKVPG